MSWALYNDLLFVFVIVVFAVAIGYSIKWHRKDLPALDDGRMLGQVQGWEVRLVDGESRVGIALDLKRGGSRLDRYYVLLTAEQARELAEWLRVAAGPHASRPSP